MKTKSGSRSRIASVKPKSPIEIVAMLKPNADYIAVRRMLGALRYDTEYSIENPNEYRIRVAVRVGDRGTTFSVASKSSRRLPKIITEYIRKHPADDVVISCNTGEVFLCVQGFEQ